MPGAAGTRILIVDDDAVQAAAIIRVLTAAGYAVSHRRDGFAGLIAVEQEQPALVVLDWTLPFITGEIFLHALQAGLDRPLPVVALLPADVAGYLQPAGVAAGLPTPVDGATLVRVVREVLADP